MLIIWLAWQLARLSWLLVPGAGEVEPPTGRPAPVQVPTRQARFDERQLASWHLFGESKQEQPVKKAKPVDAPETRLKLTLSGVFASDEPGKARAIVGDPRGQEDSYAVGDPLPGGATLSEIYPDRIILERSGRFETLRLPKEESVAGPRSVSHRDALRRSSSADSNRAAAFNRYRNEIRRNPATFLNYVRATPHKQGGRFVGFALQEGPQSGAFQELGLSPGDVVTAINGVEINSPADGMRAMRALGEGDSVNVTLLRGGQETTLSFTLPPGR
ncbi:MAG: type II secretion system protein GspC [Gammaproteobacteria bacterium]